VIKEFPTDFEFKGNRQYVHSTTIIEAVVSIVETHFLPQEDWALPKMDGQFHQEIKSNGVLRFAGEGEPLEGEGAVPARLRFYDRGRGINGIFLEDKSRKVEQRIAPVYTVHDMTLQGAFSGKCTIDGSNRIGFVENIIEANKRLHLMTLQDRGHDFKVVNLYVKGFPVHIPPDQGAHSDRLLLDIRNRSTRDRADSVVTLNTLHFPETGMHPFEMCFVVYGTRQENSR